MFANFGYYYFLKNFYAVKFTATYLHKTELSQVAALENSV